MEHDMAFDAPVSDRLTRLGTGQVVVTRGAGATTDRARLAGSTAGPGSTVVVDERATPSRRGEARP